ncbi:propionyl-CoA carboxylase, putative [Pusillimonas sp. T7-7]|uniref:acyl-CoA carboxylase subunit beta n=1 Tax=Pusillimonas sp. (strain T7-7) TaxID=1007105 RepID=UPI0002084E41|nr:carboxyl transferase domain-containing protein [Pusillimonas sp. T7-7]AEC21771.1 propionyl-CoA carboxylase, putative [Pusillimonas sp. T7-7]
MDFEYQGEQWKAEYEELHRRRKLAAAMGGEEALRKHKERGRLNARERMAVLVDPGSLREMGRIAGKGTYDDHGRLIDMKPVNALFGVGKIEGRKVVVAADDYTLRGGSSESTISEKWIYAENLAMTLSTPLIRLVDSAGGSVKLLEQQGGSKIPGYPTWPAVSLLDHVPVVGVALGPCAGLGAMKVLLSHFSVMVRDQAQVFAAGPPVVKQAYGIEVEKNDLGGYKVHRRSGLVHNEAIDEMDAFAQARRFLSYLPRNANQRPARVETGDSPERVEEWLADAIPRDRRKIYDPRKILAAICDQDSIFEIGRWHGGSVITALARIDGYPVGILCSDPKVAGGAMTTVSAYKAERHINLCKIFGLPIVNFVDQPGNETGPDAEARGTLLAAVRVLTVVEKCRVPWFSVIMRRCYGMAGGMHAPKYFPQLNHRIAWPSARWGSIPIEGGVAAAYRTEIEAAADPVAKREEIEQRFLSLGSPFRTAEAFRILDVVDPRETRAILCDWIADAWEVLATRTPHAG